MRSDNTTNEFFEESRMVHLERTDEFDRLVQKCAFEGVKLVVGESGLTAVMTNWKLQECSDKPKVFHERLLSYLGEPGTSVLEKSIAKEIFRTIGQPYPKTQAFDLQLFVEFARRLHNQSSGSSVRK